MKLNGKDILIFLKGAKGEQGVQGVGISAITSGTATESGGYTVTPITFEKTDGSTQTVEIKAKATVEIDEFVTPILLHSGSTKSEVEYAIEKFATNAVNVYYVLSPSEIVLLTNYIEEDEQWLVGVYASKGGACIVGFEIGTDEDGEDYVKTINNVISSGATGGITEERVNELITEEVGDIETAIDEIIEIQDGLQEGGSGSSNSGISIKKQVFTDVNLLIPFLYTNKDKFLKLSMNALGDVATYNQLWASEDTARVAFTFGEWLGATSELRQYMFTLEFDNNIVRMTRSIINIKPSGMESQAESLLELSYDQANAYGAVVTVYYFDEV